ncbi:hypothetical protein Tco_0966032 [Tanacetum coccineum]
MNSDRRTRNHKGDSEFYWTCKIWGRSYGLLQTGGVETERAGSQQQGYILGNRISGEIPPELGNIASLTKLYIFEGESNQSHATFDLMYLIVTSDGILLMVIIIDCYQTLKSAATASTVESLNDGGGYVAAYQKKGRMRALEQETRDLDMENKHIKVLKSSYGVTTPQELHNIRLGVIKPEIGNDVEFEINSQFMKELRGNLFTGTDDEDAHEHVRRVLEIAYLFLNHDVTHDVKMLRVFQGRKGLLKKCLHHDLNSHQKVQIFYTRLDIPTRIMLDSKGFIPLMTPTQALNSIQVMVQADQLAQMVLTNTGKRVKAKMKMGKEDMKESIPCDLPIVQPYVPLMPFQRHLKLLQNSQSERLRQILTPTVHIFPNLKLVVQLCMPLSPFRNEANVAREEEHDNDVPLQDGVNATFNPSDSSHHTTRGMGERKRNMIDEIPLQEA